MNGQFCQGLDHIIGISPRVLVSNRPFCLNILAKLVSSRSYLVVPTILVKAINTSIMQYSDVALGPWLAEHTWEFLGCSKAWRV